jgi:DNA-binding MarR family transcriptional regulator
MEKWNTTNRSSEDERSVIVQLTEKGRKLKERQPILKTN